MRNKRIFIILMFMISCCLFLNYSYATNTATIYLSSSQDMVEKDEEIEITVNIENKKTAAFELSLYFDNSKLEYISELENSNIIDNRIVFVWYDSKGGDGAKEGELAKFKFRAKEDGLATFTIQGEFYNEKAQSIQTDFKENKFKLGRKKVFYKNKQKKSKEMI